MRIVDANVVLRYLLEDDENLAAQAAKIIDAGIFELPIEVLCEIVFVLEKVYKAARLDIANQLSDFINNEDINIPHRKAVLSGLIHYSSGKLDFVDCLLAGYAGEENAEICSFDKALRKFIDSHIAPQG